MSRLVQSMYNVELATTKNTTVGKLSAHSGLVGWRGSPSASILPPRLGIVIWVGGGLGRLVGQQWSNRLFSHIGDRLSGALGLPLLHTDTQDDQRGQESHHAHQDAQADEHVDPDAGDTAGAEVHSVKPVFWRVRVTTDLQEGCMARERDTHTAGL